MRINPPGPRIDVEPEGPLPGRPLDFLVAFVRLDPVRGILGRADGAGPPGRRRCGGDGGTGRRAVVDGLLPTAVTVPRAVNPA